MNRFPLALLVFLLFLSCQEDSDTSSNLTNFLPAHSSFIVQTPDFTKFYNSIDSLGLVKDNPFLIPAAIRNNLNFLASNAIQGTSFLSFSRTGNEDLQFLLITEEQSKEINIDSLSNRSLETLTYDNFQIKKYSVEENTTFTANTKGVFLATNSRSLLEHLLTSDEEFFLHNNTFHKLQMAADANKTSVFMNHAAFDDFFNSSFPKSSLPLNSLAEWSVLEIEFPNNQVNINGISTWESQSNKLLQVFSGILPQTNDIARITPTTAAGFFSITYSNFLSLNKNLNTLRDSSVVLSDNHFLNYTGEAGLIFGKEGPVFVLKATDPELAQQAITDPEQILKEFRGASIYQSKDLSSFSNYFFPLIPEINYPNYAWLGEFLLLSENPEDLENIILNYLNKTTLSDQEYYNVAMQNLAGASSYLVVANSAELNKIISHSASEEMKPELKKLNLENYPLIALQFVEDRSFAHIHAIFSTTKNGTGNDVQQIATFSLDSPPAIPAFPVRNHATGATEMIVQDEENSLYLIDTQGNRLWKRKISARINSDIYQVDIFKNGNLQFAFSTPNALHIIDRNGDPVKPFPIEFRDEVSQPLSVFDYDNNRNYRFLITQTNELLMYDAKGRIVKGFDFKKAGSTIIQAPQHFRLNNKDYILFPEASGKLNILSRQGKSRITVKGKIDFSENEWFANNRRFVSSTEEGDLVFVNESGNIEKKPTAQNANLSVVANDNVIVSLSENILKINDEEITLDYGLYTSPKIHSVGGRTLISITDTQANRVFIFDKEANLLPGFPIYGSSGIEMGMDKEGIIFTVFEEGNSVLIYKF